MELTKFGHSCVGLHGARGRLVIDPGGLTQASAVGRADSVLITHEHFDHFSEARVRAAAVVNRRLQVFTVSAVAERLSDLGQQVHVVGDGDSFTTAGFRVEAHGSWHAFVHETVPVVPNTGFLIERRLFHPGDAFTVPDRRVSTLLVPVHAPWSRASDVIDWMRVVAPERAVAIHDGTLNLVGVALVSRLLNGDGTRESPPYVRLEPMQSALA
jgi:L-ascorbate metabolism protein UlaG (beta-lactamase superfamily)